MIAPRHLALATTEFAFLLKGVQINTAPLPRRPVSSTSCLATPLFRLDPALEVLGAVDDSCLVGCPFVIVSKGLWACAGARCELTRGTTKIQISGLHKRAKRMPIPQRNAGIAAMFHQVGGPVGASVSPVSCRCSLYFRSFRSSITAPRQTVSARSDGVYFRIKLSLRRLCAARSRLVDWSTNPP